MCWVIPPASPAATSVSRIASRSEVLPWSTWPMIVTTGGRGARLSSESSYSGASGSSSAAVTISSLRSYSSAIALIDSSVRVWVRVAISPIVISFLITSALPRPSSSATSRTVAPDGTLVASGSAGSSVLSGGSSSSGRRRRPPRRRGGRWGGGPPIWSRRAACESMTTRRFLLDAPAPAFFSAGLAFGFAVSAAFSAGFGLALVAVAAAPPLPLGPVSACSASFSSTLDAAALASIPAALRAASSSLLVTPWALAISWTRFFATKPPEPPRAARNQIWTPPSAAPHHCRPSPQLRFRGRTGLPLPAQPPRAPPRLGAAGSSSVATSASSAGDSASASGPSASSEGVRS